MAVFQVKKYKIVDGKQITKTKELWNKETRNGTMTWYFSNRYDINNKRKQYKSRLFALKRAAEDEERLFLNNPIEYIKNHSKRAKNDVIINDLKNTRDLIGYFDEFIQDKLQFTKESTAYEYRSCWNNHLVNYFENLYPKDITFEFTKEIHTQINNKIYERTGESYSIKTKNKIHATLTEFYKYLYQNNLIEFNYCKIIGNFKNPNENKNKKKKIRYQTIEQFNEFMEIVDNDFWYTFFNFLFWHGCRIGEQRALKIKNIDLENDMIHFENTFTKDKNGKEVIGAIKNKRERYTYLASQSKKHIQKLINTYKQMNNYNENWYLFGGYLPLTANNIRRTLNKYYNKLESTNENVIKLSHHEFGRHSHASYLLNEGLGRQDIYELIGLRLGDTSEVIRLTYAHPYDDINNEKIKNLLNRKENVT